MKVYKSVFQFPNWREISTSKPGMVKQLAALAIFLLLILSPIAFIGAEEGPTEGVKVDGDV